MPGEQRAELAIEREEGEASDRLRSHVIQELKANEIMQMKTRTYVWRCPGCEHELRFKADQVEAIPFFLVRHLVRIHDIEPKRIVAVEPTLTEEVKDYCRHMRIRG